MNQGFAYQNVTSHNRAAIEGLSTLHLEGRIVTSLILI